MAKKTLGPIRAGIRYQDLVAAESLLKMLRGGHAPIAVTLEDRRGGKFDDVIEWYPDRIVWQQVKWAEHPSAEPFSLAEMKAVTKTRKTSLIAKLPRATEPRRRSGNLSSSTSSAIALSIPPSNRCSRESLHASRPSCRSAIRSA